MPQIVLHAALQSYLNDTSTDTTWLAFLDSVITEVTGEIIKFIDFDWTPSRTVTLQWFQNVNQAVLRTPKYAVGALATYFTFDTTGAQTDVGTSNLFIFTDEIADGDSWRLNRNLLFKDGSYWQAGLIHKLTYQTPSAWAWPDGLQRLCLEICAAMVRDSGWGPGANGVRSIQERTTGTQTQYVDQWKEWRNRLRPYRYIA